MHTAWRGRGRREAGRSDRKTCFPFVLEDMHFKDSQESGLWMLWEWVVPHTFFPLPGTASLPSVHHFPFVSPLTQQVSASKTFSCFRRVLSSPQMRWRTPHPTHTHTPHCHDVLEWESSRAGTVLAHTLINAQHQAQTVPGT